MTLLSERGESNKSNANKVSYEALYQAQLTRKTRLESEVSLIWANTELQLLEIHDQSAQNQPKFQILYYEIAHHVTFIQ